MTETNIKGNNIIDWTPDQIKPSGAATGGKSTELYIHPLDPRYRGGLALIRVRWSIKDRKHVTMSVQQPYSDEAGLLSIVTSLVSERKQLTSQGVGSLHEELVKFDKDDKSEYVEKLRKTIAEMGAETLYAWQHMKTGVWETAPDAMQGMHPKLGYRDIVDIIPLKNEAELEKLNAKVKPIDAVQFDQERRTVTPLWQLIEA